MDPHTLTVPSQTLNFDNEPYLKEGQRNFLRHPVVQYRQLVDLLDRHRLRTSKRRSRCRLKESMKLAVPPAKRQRRTAVEVGQSLTRPRPSLIDTNLRCIKLRPAALRSAGDVFIQSRPVFYTQSDQRSVELRLHIADDARRSCLPLSFAKANNKVRVFHLCVSILIVCLCDSHVHTCPRRSVRDSRTRRRCTRSQSTSSRSVSSEATRRSVSPAATCTPVPTAA